MKQSLIVILISFFTFICSKNIKAANYYFSKDRSIGGYYYSDIYELNLEIGTAKLILPAENKILYPWVLSDQSKIFFRCNWKICVYDTKLEKVDTLSHLGYVERIDDVELVPEINEVYLNIIKAGAEADTVMRTLQNTNIILDKESYEFINKMGTFNTINSLLSRNGQIEYSLQENKMGIYFDAFKVRKSTMEAGIVFPILGHNNLNLNHAPKFYDSSNGYALVRYVSNDSAHFVICDPENKISVCDLTLLWKSCPYFNAYLSPDGDIVLDNVGNIYIYDGQTAELKQRINFTLSDNEDAHRLVLFLDDKLYYLPEDPAESDETSFDNIQSTDMSMVQSKSNLLSVIISDLDECCTKGWINNNGICNSLRKKLKNAKKHFENDKPETALNVLNAFSKELSAQKDKYINDRAWRILSLNVDLIIQSYK